MWVVHHNWWTAWRGERKIHICDGGPQKIFLFFSFHRAVHRLWWTTDIVRKLALRSLARANPLPTQTIKNRIGSSLVLWVPQPYPGYQLKPGTSSFLNYFLWFGAVASPTYEWTMKETWEFIFLLSNTLSTGKSKRNTFNFHNVVEFGFGIIISVIHYVLKGWIYIYSYK